LLPRSETVQNKPGQMSGNQNNTPKRHQFTVKNRELMTVEGVVNVESFDHKEVILHTHQGVMVIKGDQMYIKELNLEGSGMNLTGRVDSIQYLSESVGQKSKGFFGRLFR
jgi:sporulation protein YabP